MVLNVVKLIVITCISLLSPLEKGCGPLIEQTLIPFTQGYFVPIQVCLTLAL